MLAAIAGAVVGSGCRSQTGAPNALAASATPPAAVQTTRRNVSRLIALPGDIVPMAQATLYAKVPGYLDRIHVDKGDKVKAGQLLAMIRAPELTADREQARQAYLSSMASAEVSDATRRRTMQEQERARAAAEKVKADYAQGPAGREMAKAQLQQAQGAVRQAREQKTQAEAALEEGRAEIEGAQADLEAAKAEQQIAETTYDRYKGIYGKDTKLIAKQDVDEAQSRAQVAQSRTAAARSQMAAIQGQAKAAQAQVNAAQHQIERRQAEVTAAQQQVAVAEAQMNAMRKQMEVAGEEIDAHLRPGARIRGAVRESGHPRRDHHPGAPRRDLESARRTHHLLARHEEADDAGRDQPSQQKREAAARLLRNGQGFAPNASGRPQPALRGRRRGKTGKFVFVVEGSKAKRVAVTAGFDDGAFTEIVDGLSGDEEVVVVGRDALAPGGAVNATRWTPAKKK